MEFSDIKIGKYIVVNDRPCKIIKMDFSKPGRHGPGKKRVRCIDLLTDKKSDSTFNHSSQIDVPLISKEKVTIIDMCDNTITYFKGNNCITINLSSIDTEMYETALKLFNRGSDLEANIMHIDFRIGHNEFERVLEFIQK